MAKKILGMMKTAVILLVLICLALTWIVPSWAATIDTMDDLPLEEFCDEFFTAKMSEYHVPGAAIVIIKDGQVLLAKGYGYADIENEIPVDAQTTLFRVASVSKVFTIVGVLQLAEAGLLDLDQDSNHYLREFQVTNNYDEPLRINYLLTHTDGFSGR